MNLKINSQELLKGLEPLSIIIKEKHIIPILECVYINVTRDNIKFTGNNSEIGCTNSLEFKSDTSFDGCIKYSLLMTMLKNIVEQDIEIIFEENQIQIIHSKGDFKLPKFQGKEYVFMSKLSDIKDGKEQIKQTATINGNELKNSLKIANKFIINSDLEPTANVLISIGEKITIKSTNKITLFEEVIEGSGQEKDLLISPVSSFGLSHLLSDNNITFDYNDNIIFIQDNHKEITIVQQNGSFPVKSFNDIIAMIDDSNELTLDNNDLKSSLKRIGVLTDRNSNNLVKFIFNKSLLEINCDNEAFSTSGKEEMSCVFNEEKIIGFNAAFLREILSVFDEKVVLSINSKNCFCFISGNKKGLIAPVLIPK